MQLHYELINGFQFVINLTFITLLVLDKFVRGYVIKSDFFRESDQENPFVT